MMYRAWLSWQPFRQSLWEIGSRWAGIMIPDCETNSERGCCISPERKIKSWDTGSAQGRILARRSLSKMLIHSKAVSLKEYSLGKFPLLLKDIHDSWSFCFDWSVSEINYTYIVQDRNLIPNWVIQWIHVWKKKLEERGIKGWKGEAATIPLSRSGYFSLLP